MRMFYNMLPANATIGDVEEACASFRQHAYYSGAEYKIVPLGRAIIKDRIMPGNMRVLEAHMEDDTFRFGNGMVTDDHVLFNKGFVDYVNEVFSKYSVYYIAVEGLNKDNMQMPLFNEIYGTLYQLRDSKR